MKEAEDSKKMSKNCNTNKTMCFMCKGNIRAEKKMRILMPPKFCRYQKTNKISGAESKEKLVTVKLHKPMTKCQT